MIVVFLFVGVLLIRAAIKRRQYKKTVSVASATMYQPSATFAAYQKEQEKQQKEALKRAKEMERQRTQAEKLAVQKDLAFYDLEYIRHKLDQVYNLIEIAEDRQAGTIYGGKEWMKQEKEIMRLEAMAQSLKKNERKAKATIARKN